jgi:uncharacterized membrane protein
MMLEDILFAIIVIISIGFAIYFYLDAKKKDKNVSDVIKRTEDILKQKHA